MFVLMMPGMQMMKCLQPFLNKEVQFVMGCVQQSVRHLNSNTAGICKIHRLTYARLYPTTVILPDGSSFTIRFHEPRKIIKLPLDLSTLSEAERLQRLERRKPKTKVKIEEDIEDEYDAKQYVHLLKQ